MLSSVCPAAVLKPERRGSVWGEGSGCEEGFSLRRRVRVWGGSDWGDVVASRSQICPAICSQIALFQYSKQTHHGQILRLLMEQLFRNFVGVLILTFLKINPAEILNKIKQSPPVYAQSLKSNHWIIPCSKLLTKLRNWIRSGRTAFQDQKIIVSLNFWTWVEWNPGKNWPKNKNKTLSKTVPWSSYA